MPTHLTLSASHRCDNARVFKKRAFTLLVLVMLSVSAAAAVEKPVRTHALLILLPGAQLAEFSRPEMPWLSSTADHSAAAWVSACKPSDLAAFPGIRLPTPLRRDPARPFGVRADVTALARNARAARWHHVLVILDPGDLERAESYAPLCLPAKAREHREAALRAADELIGALRQDPAVGDVVLFAPRLQEGPGLAPLFWQRRGRAAGLLSSGSTHLKGVITGADLAATLAAGAGLASRGGGCRVTPVPASMSGVRGRTDSAGSPLALLRHLGALAERTDRLRAVVDYLIEWLLLLLAGAAALALRAGRRLPRLLALLPLLLPPLLLAEGAWRGGDPRAAGAIVLLLLAGWTAASTRRVPDWRALAATTAAACAVAVAAGDVLRWSMFGNSIRLGVRFYGIGNEYMGWWIGAAVLATGVPTKARVRPAAIALLVVIGIMLGLPALGGKVGGVIAALAAIILEAWPALRRRPALAGLALGAALAALLTLAAWDATRPSSAQTHFGRLALRVLAEGPRSFFLIARGKLLTNLRLTLGLWGALLFAGVWVILEARRHAPEAETTRTLSRLLPLAAVVFLTNDSGVLAAALMLSPAVLAAGNARG